MSSTLEFNPKTGQLTGPVGTLPIPLTDKLAQRFLMLVEGQCLEESIAGIATKYGFCRQRYYQLLADFKQGGLLALRSEKTGPKSNYRRTDQIVRQVLRYRFLDPDASPEVITQKLRQTHFKLSLRSVHRIIADYGVQKKTLQPQPQKAPTRNPHATRRKKDPAQVRRRSQRGTGGSPTPGK
jgi:hypothetical protein